MRYALPLLAFIILAGCAAPVRTSSNVQYHADTFSRSDLSEGGLALLPIAAGEGQEGYRRPFGDALNHSLDSLGGATPFQTWQTTVDAFNDADLAVSYQNALSTYQTTSMIDRGLLGSMSEATGTRYFLYVRLGDFEQNSRLAYSGLSGRARTQKDVGTTAFAQVWDSESGDVVWEASGSAVASSGEFTYVSEDDPNKYSAAVATSIATQLFHGR